MSQMKNHPHHSRILNSTGPRPDEYDPRPQVITDPLKILQMKQRMNNKTSSPYLYESGEIRALYQWHTNDSSMTVQRIAEMEGCNPEIIQLFWNVLGLKARDEAIPPYLQ